MANLKSRIFFIIFNIKINICYQFSINRFSFDCTMSCIYQLYFLIYQYTHFVIRQSYIYRFFLQSSNKYFSKYRFLFIVLHEFLYYCLVNLISLIYCKIRYLYLPKLCSIFCMVLVIAIPFLSCKGATY